MTSCTRVLPPTIRVSGARSDRSVKFLMLTMISYSDGSAGTRRNSKAIIPTFSLASPTLTKRRYEESQGRSSIPSKAPSLKTTTRSLLPWRKNEWAKRIVSFTCAGASVGRKSHIKRLIFLLSDVNGNKTRGLGPAPITMILWPDGMSSMSDRNSLRAASNRLPARPSAFMLALKSTTTTSSPTDLP